MSDHDAKTVEEKKDPQVQGDASRAETAAEPQMAHRHPQDNPQDPSSADARREDRPGQQGETGAQHLASGAQQLASGAQQFADEQQNQRPAQSGPVEAERERLQRDHQPVPNRQPGRSFNDPLNTIDANRQREGQQQRRVRMGHHAEHPDDKEKRPPLPGEEGWVPPARIAHPAGKPVTLNVGSPASLSGETPNAMPRETLPIWRHMAETRLSSLDQNTATARLDQAISSMRAMCLDFPYQAEGEVAMTLNFFRQLAARRQRLGTAASLGRTEDRDEVDEAVHEPPPEHFKLRALASDVMWMQETYDSILREHHLDLPDDIADRVDAIRAELDPYANEVNEEAVGDQDDHVLESDQQGNQGEGEERRRQAEPQQQPPPSPSIAHTDPTHPDQPGMADKQRAEQLGQRSAA